MQRKEASEEDVQKAINLLKKQKVTDDCLEKMEFTLSSKNNIIVTLSDDMVVLVRANGKLKPAQDIPKTWNTAFLDPDECEKIRIQHPQSELIKELKCLETPGGIEFSFVPQDGIPYKINSFTINGSKREKILKSFYLTNIISGPSDKIYEEACNLLKKEYDRLSRLYKSLGISKFNIKSQNLTILGSNFSASSIKYKTNVNSFIFNYAEMVLKYKLKGDSFQLTEPYSKWLEKLSDNLAGINTVLSLCKTFKKDRDVVKYDTDFDFEDSSAIINIKYRCIERSYKVYKASACEDEARIIREHTKNIEEDRTAAIEEIKRNHLMLLQSPVCGNLVAECIYSIVSNNMGKFKGISRSALLNIVRGCSQKCYLGGDNSGKFKLFDRYEVEGVLDLMIKYDILSTKFVKGEYTNYDKIIIGDKDKSEIVTWRRQPDSFTQYNDYDWLHELSNPSGKWNDKNILCILNHLAVYCVEPDLYISYFESAPEDVREYIKMMSTLGDRKTKKICKAINDMFKRKEKEEKKTSATS